MTQSVKTQISITVQKESFYSQLKWKVFRHPFLWIFYIFKKSKEMSVCIDKGSEKERHYALEPNNNPYFLDLEPGYHEILFEDPNAVDKANAGKVFKLGVALGLGAFTAGAGGSGLEAASAVMSSQSAKLRVGDGIIAFTIQEEEILKVSCKATRKGSVKIKLLN